MQLLQVLGSFTGIRIGIASIKAISEFKNKKIVSVNSLLSLAGNEEGLNEDYICSLIDARNNQAYMGLFNKDLEEQEELMADDINACLDKIKNYNNICFVGNGAILHKDLISKNFEGKTIRFSESNKQTVKGLWKSSLKEIKKGNIKNADELVPIYLRKSQAERLKNK